MRAPNQSQRRLFSPGGMFVYLLGVAVCWGTEVLFWRIHSHASPLAFFLFMIEELIRSLETTIFGSGGSYPPGSGSASVLLSAIAVASVFPLLFLIFGSGNKFLRWIAFSAAVLLFGATLYWPQTPGDLF